MRPSDDVMLWSLTKRYALQHHVHSVYEVKSPAKFTIKICTADSAMSALTQAASKSAALDISELQSLHLDHKSLVKLSSNTELPCSLNSS